MQYGRFIIVAALGVTLDISLAWILLSYTGLPITLAAAFGFISAATLNYTLHEIWTFSTTSRTLSLKRAGKYLAAQTFTLAIRLFLVGFLQEITLFGEHQLIVLSFATAMTFSLNFFISERFIFKLADKYQRKD